MNFSTTLKFVLALFACYIQSGLAQTGFTYKIVFQNEISKQSAEVTSLLQKYAADQKLMYKSEDNAIILTSSKPVNAESLMGKLAKLQTPALKVELLENLPVTNNNAVQQVPVNPKEVQDKALRKQQLLEERMEKEKNK